MKLTTILICFMLLAGSVWAKESARYKTLSSAVVRAEKKALQKRNAQVNISFAWEKKIWLSDMVHRRRPGFRDVVVNVEKKEKNCSGILLSGKNQVATVAACVKGVKGFELKSVRLDFINGKNAQVSTSMIKVKQGIAYIAVPEDLTRGLEGVPFEQLPQGKSLEEHFGPSVLGELTQFFISKGVLSARSRHFNKVRLTLKKGDPFYYQGKAVALVNTVPTRLPVSFWGGLSEENLVVFRL